MEAKESRPSNANVPLLRCNTHRKRWGCIVQVLHQMNAVFICNTLGLHSHQQAEGGLGDARIIQGSWLSQWRWQPARTANVWGTQCCTRTKGGTGGQKLIQVPKGTLSGTVAQQKLEAGVTARSNATPVQRRDIAQCDPRIGTQA